MMRGAVYQFNHAIDRVAIETPNGFTIVELRSRSRIEKGDEIEWHSDIGDGYQDYINRTRGDAIVPVTVLNHWVGLHELRYQMGFD